MLYIHIPFCKSRCIYCGFLSSTENTGIADRYVEAVLTELDSRFHQFPKGYPETVYIGGGTPSFLPSSTLKKLLDGIKLRIDLSKVIEYTVEVNPDDVSPELLDLLRANGVNRISMGIQTFDDKLLKFLNRRHTSDIARNAILLLKEGGWNYSLDLIYGLPGQDLKDWELSLDELLGFKPPLFSAYMLSFEEYTPLGRMLDENKVCETDEDIEAEMYDLLCLKATNSGYSHYEISNFAIPGKQAVHNSRYWENYEYVGLGAGASSFNSGKHGYNGDSIIKYINAIESGELATEYEDEDDKDAYNTLLFIKLRTVQGVRLSDIPDKFKSDFIKKAQKLLHYDNDQYYIPEKEWLKSDFIIREMFIL